MSELNLEKRPKKEGVFSPGDELSEKLLNHIRGLARRMLFSYPNVRRWDETDDIANEAALRLWQSLGQVEVNSETHFLRLVALQIRRVLIDLARSYGGKYGLSSNHDTGYADAEFPDRAQPNLSRWTAFHEAVEQLPDDARQVFDLLWYSGLSRAEVCDVLQVSRSTLMKRWRKARLELTKAMGVDAVDGSLKR